MSDELSITAVDICFGAAWGDEAKGKITAVLARSKRYSFVCRWNGGNNAGHTVYVNGEKYATHLIPSGIFYGIPSIIGPGCVVNKADFEKEMNYLKEAGFDTSLVKISPMAHIVTDAHIQEDKDKYYATQGTTAKGIAPAYRDKYGRIGTRVGTDEFFAPYLWDGKLHGRILCEGAQGMWLDIDYGSYPYVTSSHTLPFAACSLGFPPQYIDKIYGAAKIYDTRSGTDPDFPEELLEDSDLLKIADAGHEYGTTTGRRRKVNWLNMNKLIDTVNITGITDLIISKTDVLEHVGLYKFLHNEKLNGFMNLSDMEDGVKELLMENCKLLKTVIFSADPENVPELD